MLPLTPRTQSRVGGSRTHTSTLKRRVRCHYATTPQWEVVHVCKTDERPSLVAPSPQSQIPGPKSAIRNRAGREALESSSPALQASATPSATDPKKEGRAPLVTPGLARSDKGIAVS